MANNQPTGIIPWLQQNVYDPAKQALTHFGPPPGAAQGINQALAKSPASIVESAGHAIYNVPSDIASIGKNIASGPVGQAIYNPNPAQPAAAPHHAAAASPPSDSLTWNAIAGKALQPLIDSSFPTGSQINAQLAPYAQGVPSSIGHSIASSLQSSISDYKGGLSSMLQTLPEQQTQAALLAGLKNVIQYPVSGLTGTQGAPPSVQNNQALLNLYATLNAERSGGNPTSGTGFFGASGNGPQSANPYNDPNGVNKLLGG